MAGNMLSAQKAMTLLYLNPQVQMTAEQLLVAELVPEMYFTVMQMPLQELFNSRHPVALFEEIVTLTLTENWRKQNRRPIMQGDVMFRGSDPWLLLHTKDLKVIPSDKAVLPLKAWPEFGILNIDKAHSLKQMVCHL